MPMLTQPGPPFDRAHANTTPGQVLHVMGARRHFALPIPPCDSSYIYPRQWHGWGGGGWVTLLREQIIPGVGQIRLTLPAFFRDVPTRQGQI